MHFVLYSVVQQCRVGDPFATEREIWAFVGAQHLFTEVIDREDLELQRVLDPRYQIHVCGTDDPRTNERIIRQSR